MIWSKCLYLMPRLQVGWVGDRLQTCREAETGFLNKKVWGSWGDRVAVSLSFLQVGASGLQDVSWEDGLGKGLGCSQVQEGQSDRWPLWLSPDVYCARWERVSIKPRAIKQVRVTESWAVRRVGNWPDPFNCLTLFISTLPVPWIYYQ